MAAIYAKGVGTSLVQLLHDIKHRTVQGPDNQVLDDSYHYNRGQSDAQVAPLLATENCFPINRTVAPPNQSGYPKR